MVWWNYVSIFKFENEFDRSWKLNLTEKSGNVSFGPNVESSDSNELESLKKKVSVRTLKDGNSGESFKLVLFLDDFSEVWINKLWKGPTFGSWSKYTSKNVSGVGCFVISVPETTWTWIFQKCAKMAKKHLYFMIRSRLFMLRNHWWLKMVKMLKQGEVCTECWAWGSVFGLLGVGQCFWPIRRGSVLYLWLMQAWCRGVGRLLPEF